MKVLAYAAAASALLLAAACNQTEPVTAPDAAPEATAPAGDAPMMANQAADFAQAAAQSNMLEIQASQVALEKSTNAEVKAYAQMMIDDHTAAGQQLQQIAASAPMTLPAAPDGMTETLLNNLRNADAAGFDDKYLDTMIDAHEDAINRFEAYARDGDNAALQTFATNTLPTLRSHLERGNALREQINRT